MIVPVNIQHWMCLSVVANRTNRWLG